MRIDVSGGIKAINENRPAVYFDTSTHVYQNASEDEKFLFASSFEEVLEDVSKKGMRVDSFKNSWASRGHPVNFTIRPDFNQFKKTK